MPAQCSTSIFNKFQPKCQGFSCLRPELPVDTTRFGTSGYHGCRPRALLVGVMRRAVRAVGELPLRQSPPFPQKNLKSFKLIRSGADRVSKSWPWSPNMKTLYREKPAWLAAGLRITFLGLIALLLLPALAPGQSAWPSGGAPTSLPGESEVRPGNLSPPGLRSAAPGRENLGRHPARPQVASRPASGFHQNCSRLTGGLGSAPVALPSAAGVRLPLANQSAPVSGDLADAWVYDYRSLAGICPRGWGRR